MKIAKISLIAIALVFIGCGGGGGSSTTSSSTTTGTTGSTGGTTTTVDSTLSRGGLPPGFTTTKVIN